jgi:hypothetical protein
MGVNLIAEIDGFEVYEENFHKRGPGAPPGSTVDGSVEDGCISEGTHRVLRFNLHCKNIGDKPLVIGNPASRPDIFEPSTVHRSGYIMKDKFNVYTLKNDHGLKMEGFKRPFCLESGPPFTCQNQGIAPNATDHYTSDLACQFIMIDNLSDGDYTIEATTNATSVLAAKEKANKILFEEDNYDDNTVRVKLHLEGDNVNPI